MDWFEIFKVGKHTDSAGNTRDWTLKDLEEIASSYKPQEHEAPIVIGHPDMDSPAYGWIEALKVEGEKLLAKPGQVVDQLKDWVRKGLYKKVSIAIYPDLTLRHVGFLGGTPPAIKGLKQATFGDKKPAWIIESDLFMEPWQQENIRSLFQRIREWIIDKFGLDEANKVMTAYDIDLLMPPKEEKTIGSPAYADKGCSHLNEDDTFIGGFDGCVEHMMSCEGLAEENANRLCAYIGRKAGKMSEATDTNKKGGTIMTLKEFLEKMKGLFVEAEKGLSDTGHGHGHDVRFTEADIQAKVQEAKDQTFAEAQKKIDAEKKEKEDALKRLKEIEDQKRKGDITSFCEALCKEGKLTPALRKIVEPIMVAVSAPPLQGEGKGGDGLIEFSDGTKKSALDGIKDFLNEIPKVVIFKEVTPKDGPATGGSAGEKLSALTKTKMEQKKDLSYSAAFAEVQRENIELAKELLEEIRPKK